jgi:uncharacterized damage-inducible protein DinB
MNSTILSEIFKRDLNRLKNEILSYRDDAAIWRTEGEIKNSGGNLCLHLIGNLNTYIGTVLGDSNYIRNRELEFSQKDVPTPELVKMIEDTITAVTDTLDRLSPDKYQEEYPVVVFEVKTTIGFMLVHLASHLAYHLGQVNYHRRLLDRGFR